MPGDCERLHGVSKLRFQVSVSLDGFVAGPNPSEEYPLGEGGMALHEWAFKLAAWRKPHGREGGEVNASSAVIEETLDNVGATIMGRKMFGGDPGPWGEEPWDGWWGDDPPFHHPVFVAHSPRAGDAAKGRRQQLHLRHRRNRGGACAGARGGGRQGRLARGRRRSRPAVPARPVWSTRCCSTSCRSCSATARRCSTGSGRRSSWSSCERSRRPASPISFTARLPRSRSRCPSGRGCGWASRRFGSRIPTTRGCGRRPPGAGASPRSQRSSAGLPK